MSGYEIVNLGEIDFGGLEKSPAKMVKKVGKKRSRVVSMRKSVEQSDKLDQYRNKIIYLLDAYGNISEKLTEDHKKLMHETPFKLFFKAIEEKRICGNKRKDQVLDHIITLYNPDKKAFRIGKEYCTIHRSDIKLIFGIIDGETKVDNAHGKRCKSKFADRVFPNIDYITAKMMKDKLVELVANNDKIAVADTIRVLCLLMFQSCFFTNTGTTIAWTYVKYVEELDKLKYYDWSTVIYETLIASLEEKSKKPRKVVGCTASLLYWLCEHAKALQPREEEDPMKQENQEDVASFEYRGIPRCTKWDLTILNIFVNKQKIMTIPKESVIWMELDPTPAELQLIPDLVNNPIGQLMQVVDDSDFELDIPTQPLETDNASKNRRFNNEGSKMQDENDAYQTEENAEFMDDPFEGKVQATSELEKEEKESRDKTIKEKDDKIEQLEAKVKKPRKKLRKTNARNKDLGEGNTEKSDEVEAEADNVNMMASDTIQNVELQQKEDEISKHKVYIRVLEENVVYLQQRNDALLVKLKNLEKENCEKGSVNDKLKSTVTELQGMKQSYESKIEEQGTTIDALHIEIQKLQDQDMDEMVHAVTQQYADKDAKEEEGVKEEEEGVKEKEEAAKQNSRIIAIKARKRITQKDDDFVYPEEKKIRNEIVDLTSESAAECVKTRSKTVKASLRAKKGDYPCGEKITNEAFELLHTTLHSPGRLGVLWSDDNGNMITVHDMVNLLEGNFIADKVIDAFATMLSRIEQVQVGCHILPAATWAWCKKYEEDENYSNQFVNNMEEHIKMGKKILIPMCCPGKKNDPYHWILVTFDSGEKGEWYMYNSISSREGVVDPFEKDAVDVQKYIWKCFCPSNSNGLKLEKLKKFGKVPLQGSDTNDCAVYVMYYMYQIVRNQPIDEKWKPDEVQEFKAFIVNCIASNQMIGM